MGLVFMVRQQSDMTRHHPLKVDRIVTRSESSVKLVFQEFLKSQAIDGFMVRQLSNRIFMILPTSDRVSAWAVS